MGKSNKMLNEKSEQRRSHKRTLNVLENERRIHLRVY